MSNPFQPNTTYWKPFNPLDGRWGGCKQATYLDGKWYGFFLRVCKTTAYTITTPDGKRYKVCCDKYGTYVKVGVITFYFGDVEKLYPNKNKKADISDETLKRFAKQFKILREMDVKLSDENAYDYLNHYISKWRGSIDEDMTLDDYMVKYVLAY